MLQKGIIETVEDKFTVKVRVPRYDKLSSSADGTSTKDLSRGIVCTLPGMNVTYAIGDVVLVDFENDELSKPVILGLLYREQESKSVLELKQVDSSIDDINSKLDELSGKNLYTHVKYSNDSGRTFTSLFDPSAIVENDDFTLSPKSTIELPNTTSAISWSIIDSNNINVTSNFNIETTLTGSNKDKSINLTQTEYGDIIQPYFQFKACTGITLNFKLNIPITDISKYYIVLATNDTPVGNVYGDYVGIQVSNSASPSLNTVDYTWSSIRSRNDLSVEKLSDDLLPRIQANEIDLRGYSSDDTNSDTQTGLLEAINVSLSTILIGLNRSKIYFGTTGQYVQPGDSSLHINSVVRTEFETLRIVDANDTPHLQIIYSEE